MQCSVSLRRLYQVAGTVPGEEQGNTTRKPARLIYKNIYYARTYLVPNIADEENLKIHNKLLESHIVLLEANA